METVEEVNTTWEAIPEIFFEWLGDRRHLLEPGLHPQPTIKIIVFLALLDSNKSITYKELKNIIHTRNVIKGYISDNTLRTSVLALSKTLDKFNHSLTLKSSRGLFELIEREKTQKNYTPSPPSAVDPVVLLLEPHAIKMEDIAKTIVEKAFLPLPSLYFLEWSARWWLNYSSQEAEIRVQYESDAWQHLQIKERLNNSINNQLIGFVSLAPGEGLAEIALLEKILSENIKIHYLAVDSSPRLLRDHIGLLKERLSLEIENGNLICSGIVADIFSGLREALDKVRKEFIKKGIFHLEQDFLPASSGLLITYFGNCLGNNCQDQETEFFSMIQSIFSNRPLEILTGVSVMRDVPDEYIRNWDDFMLQAPRHLLETKKFLRSLQDNEKETLSEFLLPEKYETDRCPPVKPETYIVRHGIEGQIYRFYYKLSFDLDLNPNLNKISHPLPKGSLILLYSIIKYKMDTLVAGIEKSGLFKIKYEKSYHQIVDTPNGKREYAVFSAYLEK